ncbi:uncharacterized protein [Haliotis asinina]|uniref:uncharacterized protein n=1 Tax=Haliotis asinina TaxID=109174 RepID=UPI0035318F94
MSSCRSELATDYTDGCQKCQAVGQSYICEYNNVNILTLHTTHAIICAGKKSGQLLEKKKKTLDRFGKTVSAWRNSGGGQVLIHVEGQLPEDRCLEQFDEFITKTLTDLLDDEELYVEAYRRGWLSEIHEFLGNTDFILVNVKETNGVSTVDFNTKAKNDIENVPVTSARLAKCMSRETYKSTQKPKTKGLCENIQQLHESRNTEVKSLHLAKLKKQIAQQVSKSPADIVDFIWHELKLKDNLTSLSKVEGGGSYYVGISEYTLEFESYRTKLLNVDGFPINFPEFEIINAIKCKLQSETIALQKGTFCSVPDDLIEVKFHAIPGKQGRVLEVAVRWFDGIIFNDKDGPRAYEVKNNAIQRMDKEAWLKRYHPHRRRSLP